MKPMARAFASLLLILGATAGAQAAELYGIVSENELGGSVMNGVAIAAEGASPTATDHGQFKLIFPKKQPGQVVVVTVHKDGFQVVNDVQLEVTLSDSP